MNKLTEEQIRACKQMIQKYEVPINILADVCSVHPNTIRNGIKDIDLKDKTNELEYKTKEYDDYRESHTLENCIKIREENN